MICVSLFLSRGNGDCTCLMTTNTVGITVFWGCYSDSCFLFQRRVKFYKTACRMLYFFSLWTCPSPWNTQAFMNPLQPIWSRWVLRTTLFINKLQKLRIRSNALVALWLKFIRRCEISLYKMFRVRSFLSSIFPPLWWKL